MKYSVTLTYDASKTVLVDASSEEEAKRKALEQAAVSSLGELDSIELNPDYIPVYPENN